MKEISFPICFIEVNRMRLICGMLTCVVFQVAYIKRQWVALLMSQFHFHYVFSGTPMRLKQIRSKTNKNILKLAVLTHCHMLKLLNRSYVKKQDNKYWLSQTTLKSTEKTCKL